MKRLIPVLSTASWFAPSSRAALGAAVLFMLAMGLSACGGGGEESGSAGEAAARGAAGQDGGNVIDVRILEPPATLAAGTAFTFRWEASADAETWMIKVFNQRMGLLWSSPETSASDLVAPPELLRLMEAGESYNWRLIGRGGKAGRVRSSLQRVMVN